VGSEPLQWLFEQTARAWAHASARRHAWRGLALYAVDGSTLNVADSDENREHFGLVPSHRGASAYPHVRLAAVMALRSHLLAAAQMGPYEVSEHKLCEPLWAEIPDQSLTIMDRGFLASNLLHGLQREGAQRHWLLRAKSNTKWTVVRSLGRNDQLVELAVSWLSRDRDPSLPPTLLARAIAYRSPKSRAQQWLLTSLVNPTAYPAREVVTLYRERWEIELGYDEVKTHLLEREETIRSRTIDGVYQEVWGILVAYNLVRLEMERIAAEADVAPSRISFVTALRFIRDEWSWCAVASPGAIPARLQRLRDRIKSFILPARRTKRSCPREVKIKMSNYPRKRRGPEQEAAK
jgi:hypothetical protein